MMLFVIFETMAMYLMLYYSTNLFIFLSYSLLSDSYLYYLSYLCYLLIVIY